MKIKNYNQDFFILVRFTCAFIFLRCTEWESPVHSSFYGAPNKSHLCIHFHAMSWIFQSFIIFNPFVVFSLRDNPNWWFLSNNPKSPETTFFMNIAYCAHLNTCNLLYLNSYFIDFKSTTTSLFKLRWEKFNFLRKK